jgi:predicted XRE-type DNA-binding protein
MAKTVKSKENLFRSFGISSASSENLQIRSTLMIELTKFIERRGMTQVQAADYFGVSQPCISA